MHTFAWCVPAILNEDMTKNASKILVPLIVLLLASGCGGYNKLLKSPDKELKYRTALDYYNKGDYDKALQLFEDVRVIFQGTVKEDSILFYTADSHFLSRDYGSSALEFDDLRRRFGRSPFLEQAEYKYAMGFYYMSPDYNRDQSATMMAMSAIKEYLNRYPESLKKQLCLVRIDEMQNKLYDKSFINAKTYYKIGRYKSAVTALRSALGEYPTTPHKEEILYLTTKSCYELAANSVQSLQRDRYLDMMDTYYTFAAAFPDSKYMRELSRLQNTAKEYLAKHQTDEIE